MEHYNTLIYVKWRVIQFEGLRYELIDGVCHMTVDMKKGDEIHQAPSQHISPGRS